MEDKDLVEVVTLTDSEGKDVDFDHLLTFEFQGKTIVTVSHELNFIARADEIVVLKQGRVVGSGSHETLMEQCPDYRELVEEQSYEEVYEA